MKKKLLVMSLLAVSPAAFAGIVIGGLPPVQSLPGQPKVPTTTAATTSATATTQSASTPPKTSANYTVPAIKGNGRLAVALPPSPAQVWNQAIATPPEGKESASTKALAQQALQAAKDSDATLPVVPGQNGMVSSLYGRPVLVCSPLHTCVIELPAGVKPVVTAGLSKAEWNVQQAMVGDQGEVFLSPKFAGLHQDIVIAGTAADGTAGKTPVNFGVRLVSDKTRYVPFLKIAGTGGLVHNWKTGVRSDSDMGDWSSLASPSPRSASQKPQPSVPPLPNVNLVGKVNPDWRISCGGGGWFASSDCQPIKPLRVYADGTHTFIQMPDGLASHGGFPILQAFDKSGQQIGVNTQIRGDEYVVDSVPPKIRLVLGKEIVDIREKQQ